MNMKKYIINCMLVILLITLVRNYFVNEDNKEINYKKIMNNIDVSSKWVDLKVNY